MAVDAPVYALAHEREWLDPEVVHARVDGAHSVAQLQNGRLQGVVVNKYRFCFVIIVCDLAAVFL